MKLFIVCSSMKAFSVAESYDSAMAEARKILDPKKYLSLDDNLKSLQEIESGEKGYCVRSVDVPYPSDEELNDEFFDWLQYVKKFEKNKKNDEKKQKNQQIKQDQIGLVKDDFQRFMAKIDKLSIVESERQYYILAEGTGLSDIFQYQHGLIFVNKNGTYKTYTSIDRAVKALKALGWKHNINLVLNASTLEC